MKKLINDVSTVVSEMLDGLIALNPQLSLLQGGTIVLRADAQAVAARGEVALISGGGSGHEPAHGGYVGHGMLSAAVAGEVFTSPSTDAVLDAIRAVAGPAGALLIVKNYTGDRFNFGLAAEIARAEGILVEMMIVADDVALSASGDHAGRRGLAGTVLVHKIAGAAAARGLPLAEVARLAREAAASLGTMGVALTPCTVPAAGQPGFALGDGEIEWGLGIHGEPGVARGALEPADAIVGKLLAKIVDDLALQAGERVALLVNNLGGTPPSELNVVAGAALRELAGRGIEVARAWAGTFLSALEMAGVSLTVLRIDDERLSLLDAASQTSAWPALSGRVAQVAVRAAPPVPQSASGATLARDATLRRAIEAVCECLPAGSRADIDRNGPARRRRRPRHQPRARRTRGAARARFLRVRNHPGRGIARHVGDAAARGGRHVGSAVRGDAAARGGRARTVGRDHRAAMGDGVQRRCRWV
ncbi:dihydroxyacetone kinase DhaK subunit [Paraburkholderia sp. Cpub6]|nr:dihydroxyacetone kinase DhaK subunit [Paraburkholderia sp. Cpub6]